MTIVSERSFNVRELLCHECLFVVGVSNPSRHGFKMEEFAVVVVDCCGIMSVKKVIFIGGTSFSGSTFFHLTLANTPTGFAVGEINHLFRPMKKRHTKSTWQCSCDNPDCDLWPRVKKRGESHLYETIFQLHPEVDYIVGASKNIIWTVDQINNLARQGIESRCIVIWKTLSEFAHSLNKRNRLRGNNGIELARWPQYHRNFYSFVKRFRTVKYADYTRNQAAVLRAVTETLDIPYREGQERYWEKTHHALGGNLSSRIHLYSKESSRYQDLQRRGQGHRSDLVSAAKNHRRIYYEEPNDTGLQNYIDALRQSTPYVDQIAEMLAARDVRLPGPPMQEWPKLKVGAFNRRMKQARQFARSRMRWFEFAK